VDVRASRPDR